MRQTILPVAIAAVILASCNANHEQSEYLASADSTSFAEDPTSITSSSRKIARSADLKCQVTNVLSATTEVEKKVNGISGMVVTSSVENRLLQEERLSYKPDSLKVVKTYTPVAHLEVKVPFFYLDSLLQTIPSIASFVEYRKISQDDRTLAYLSNALRNKAHVQELATKPPVPDTTDKTGKMIDRKIANLQIMDDVNYATLTIEFTQPEQVFAIVVPNTDRMLSEPFTTRLANGMYKGLLFFQALAIGLAAIWPVWLIGGAVYIWYRKKIKNKPLIGDPR